MKKKLILKSKWILVTGASSGLGSEMARQLANDHQANLILVARRTEKLEALKKELEVNSSIQCITITADLTRQEDLQRIYKVCTKNQTIDGAILNAGITYFGEQRDISSQKVKEILSTNVDSVIQLSSLLIPHLVQQSQPGSLVLISSMAGLIPLPYQAVYSGSKAFMISYGECLRQELKNENLSITTIAPGGIDTEMSEKMGFTQHFSGTLQMQSASFCAAKTIQAMIHRKVLYIPGVFNQFQYHLSRFVPRRLTSYLIARAYRKVL